MCDTKNGVPLFAAGRAHLPISSSVRLAAHRGGAAPSPDLDESDFEQVGSAFQHPDRSTRKLLIGNAHCTMLPVQAPVDFAVPWFREHR